MRYAAHLEKQRQRNSKQKKVGEMGTREHKNMMKKWKEQKQKQRKLEKTRRFRPSTPPSESNPQLIPRMEPSGNQRRGRRVIDRNRMACYRTNPKLKRENKEKEEKIMEKEAKIAKLQAEKRQTYTIFVIFLDCFEFYILPVI